MRAMTTGTAAPVGRGGPRARRQLLALVAIVLVFAAWAAWYATSAATPTGRAVAMSPECRQAYRGYMEATDPAEADFWAESWMTFGCESGGYWA